MYMYVQYVQYGMCFYVHFLLPYSRQLNEPLMTFKSHPMYIDAASKW